MNELYLREIRLAENARPKGYLAELPAVRRLLDGWRLPLCKRVTFLVGENGTGKSTLLEAIAVAWGFNAEGGSLNFQFHTAETHSDLGGLLRLTKGASRPRDGFFLRAESFYNAVSYLDELDRIPATSRQLKESYGGKSLHEMSHGESFLALALNRFSGHGLYIFDEPEAALSPFRQMTLLARIHQLAEADSQLLISTHSPILMAYPEAEIYCLSKDGIKLTAYRETEHYLLTKAFLNNPERMLRELLKE